MTAASGPDAAAGDSAQDRKSAASAPPPPPPRHGVGNNVAHDHDDFAARPQDTGRDTAHHRGRLAIAGLIIALAAATALIVLPGRKDPAPATPAVAQAQRAQLPGNLTDGPIFSPGLFLDARTAIGTAPTPDGAALRLVLRAPDGAVTEIRRRPLTQNPTFDSFTTDGTTIAWTESAATRTEVWAAAADGTTARRLTADTGNVIGYGSAYDLVIAEGAAHWAAAAGDNTEIRSAPLAGGPVTTTKQDGVWSLTTWPWLVNGAGDQTGATRLRNPVTNRDIDVRTSGAELATCGPALCRVLVVAAGGLARIDVMRPDGGERRRIAGPEATAALVDAAVLDRFEVLGRERPDSAATGTEGLVVHDLADGVTTELAAAAESAHARNGVVWWSTGGLDDTVWHTIDLRTAAQRNARR